MSETKRALTPKQQRFVDEYLVDLNATDAARRAGYSENTARQTGAENLSKPDIARAIQVAQAERSKSTGLTAERVVQELGRLALADVRKLFNDEGELRPLNELDDDMAAAIAAVDIVTMGQGQNEAPLYVRKVKLWDKGAALDKLMKHLGAYAPDKVDVDVTDKAARIWEARKRVGDSD